MLATFLFALVTPVQAQQPDATSGQMTGIGPRDRAPLVFPLRSTVVDANVAGIAARVVVVQTFTNPSRTPIEAVYTFPLPADAAVDRMRIKIGDRVVEGEIKRAEEARAIYDAAKAAGQTAALLDQERPNIFTQSIANVMPGASVQVEISYVEVLKFEDGEFEFTFPMVVGPRNTMNAPDPGSIAPPVVPKGLRTGSDIALTVHLDAGVSLQKVGSPLHAININKRGAGKYDVSLSRKDEIPNRDFILKWTPAGTGVTEGLIADGGGTFCLTLIPPRGDAERFATPREVVFVMDQSGSQQGFPIEKSKELTLAMIDKLRPDDLFNVVTFTTGVSHLWPESVPNTPQRVREARTFIQGLQAGGGTDFLPPLKATMTSPGVRGHAKLIVFNSDGYVGDDFSIMEMVQKNRANARLFTFGIGGSVNRFLIDGMSAEGRGGSEIVTLASDVSPAIARFLKRTQTPVLTDVTVRVEGGGVHDVTPEVVPDLFADRPLVVIGRYDRAGPAKVTIGGRLGGRPWSRTIDVDLPAPGAGDDVITKVWARRRLDDMVRQDWMAAVRTTRSQKEYTEDDDRFAQFALQHGIMSQWTSFVAVEKRVVNIGGRQRTVRVPVEMAEGVSYGGVFGLAGREKRYNASQSVLRMRGGSAGGAGASTTGGGGGGTTGGGRGVAGTPPAILLANPSLGLKLRDENPELKIHKDLRNKKEGKFEVQVLLRELPKDWKKTLEEAGLKVEDSEEGLKVVFGIVDAKRLMDLAKLTFVDEIRPLEE